MNTDEAREAAWIQCVLDHNGDRFIPRPEVFAAGWDARGEYDAQQIAALVEAAKDALPVLERLTRSPNEPGRGNSLTHNIYGELAAPLVDLINALRALAGQSEEATG